VAQELEIAKQVQARLFPQGAPALKTLDYAGVCIQARHVGVTITTSFRSDRPSWDC